jgi:hypothetical protein
MFFQLAKVDEEKRLVYGIATAEEVDKSGEICDYATTKPHYEAWSAEFSKATDGGSLGNLRSMHGKVAAGKIVDMEMDDSKRQIRVCAKVVDDQEWRKVLEGVYTGFSQGGSYLKRWEDPDAPGIKRYTAKPSEISLVDTPCLATARFEIRKADGMVEEREFVKYDDSESRDDHSKWTAGSSATTTREKIDRAHASLRAGHEGKSMPSNGDRKAYKIGKDYAREKKTISENGGYWSKGRINVATLAAQGKFGDHLDSIAGAEKSAVSYDYLEDALAVSDDDLDKAALSILILEDMAKTLCLGITDEEVEDWIEEGLGKFDASEARDDAGKWTKEMASATAAVNARADRIAARHGIGKKLTPSQRLRDKRPDGVTNRAFNAARGAVVGGMQGLKGSLPYAAYSTVFGAPEAGLAEVVASTSYGAAAGAAAGLGTRTASHVDNNAEAAARAVGIGRGLLSAARFVGSKVGPGIQRAVGEKIVRTAAQRANKSGFRGPFRPNAKYPDRYPSRFGNYKPGESTDLDQTDVSYTSKIADQLYDLEKLGLGADIIVQIVEDLAKEEEFMTLSNADVARRAGELAKAAGDETRWPDYVGKARDELTKVAEPVVEKVETTETAPVVEKTETPVVDLDSEVSQVWLAKDGSPHKKKADAIAQNERIAKEGAHVSATDLARSVLSKLDEVGKDPALLKSTQLSRLAKFCGAEAWDAGRAISAINIIVDLINGEMAEQEGGEEGQITSLKSALDSLKEFVASEIMENHSDSEDDSSDDTASDPTMQMFARIGEMVKAAGGGNAELAKAGARNSAEDKKHLKAAHDHIAAMEPSCCDKGDDASKTVVVGDLEKSIASITEERNTLSKALETIGPRLEELGTLIRSQSEKIVAQTDEIEALKRTPVPAPRLRVVEKGGDVVTLAEDPVDMADLNKRIAALPERERAELMIKVSQQRPLGVGTFHRGT